MYGRLRLSMSCLICSSSASSAARLLPLGQLANSSQLSAGNATSALGSKALSHLTPGGALSPSVRPPVAGIRMRCISAPHPAQSQPAVSPQACGRSHSSPHVRTVPEGAPTAWQLSLVPSQCWTTTRRWEPLFLQQEAAAALLRPWRPLAHLDGPPVILDMEQHHILFSVDRCFHQSVSGCGDDVIDAAGCVGEESGVLVLFLVHGLLGIDACGLNSDDLTASRVGAPRRAQRRRRFGSAEASSLQVHQSIEGAI
eukprot:CAMPEP_0178417476 /NCGR_PEP_ID=MMETSP0689_2-20121128/24593_1 /TAXON_ID=160604 /ORGANISM="Amphidinium massartii, Strain CS-259" /LENGTH=254 /DNA_ID=CAMNT_0020038841 /DNA_START=193 /DNA_END=959 /DNA_ORIENTATION=-